MATNSELFAQLQSCAWAINVGLPEPLAKTCGSLDEIDGRLETDPDEFFRPPYETPYEALCVKDHELAASLTTIAHSKEIGAISKAAYLTTWKSIPVSEICALVSDDADTLATLLVADIRLPPFTHDRLNWYLRGRIPFGYLGEHPNGTWLIL